MSHTHAYCQEIIRQLKGKGLWVFGSWGSRSFVDMGEVFDIPTDDQGSVRTIKCRACLRFRVSGRLHTGLVYVVLTGADDYTIIIAKDKRGLMPYAKITKELNGIYCDQLVDVVDRLVETP